MKQQRVRMDYTCTIMSETKLKALHEFGNTVVNKCFTPEEIKKEYETVGIIVDVLPFDSFRYGYCNSDVDNCWKVVVVKTL